MSRQFEQTGCLSPPGLTFILTSGLGLRRGSEPRLLQVQVNRLGIKQSLAPGEGAGGDINDGLVKAFSCLCRILLVLDHGP